MTVRQARPHAHAAELLRSLAHAQEELWTRGGVARHQRRRHLIESALAAGCAVDDVADILDITPADVLSFRRAV